MNTAPRSCSPSVLAPAPRLRTSAVWTSAVWPGAALLLLAASASAQIGVTVRDESRIGAESGGFGGTLDPVDRFGEALAGLGDLDGDGVPDIAVGAPADDGPGINRGAVHVLRMNADGTVKASIELGEGSGGFPFALDDGACFGAALAALGDLDGDGVPDLAVGARDQDAPGASRGAVFVLFLNADGSVREATTIAEGQGGLSGTLDDFDYFGHGVAALGDLDGDGVTELAVGATGDDDAGPNAGAVTVLFLDAAGQVLSQQKITSGQGGFGDTLESGSNFGEGLAGLGDVDGDGIPDLAIGAWGEDDSSGPASGVVWTLLLNADGTVRAEQRITEGSGGFDGELDGNDAFGRSLDGMGDVDGDGVPDLVVGANGDRDGGSRHGAVWVLFLDASGAVRFDNKISETAGYFGGELENADFFGWGVAAAGDLDGDGTGDLVVGAPQDDEGGFDTGAVWVLSLSDGPIFGAGDAGATGGRSTAAAVSVRNGSGINPVVFQPVGLPLLGIDWDATVDTTALGGTGFTLAAVFGASSSGLVVTPGELLVDPSGGLLASSSAFAFGTSATHTFALPADSSQAGVTVHVQVLVTIGTTNTLTNALEVTLGR